MPDNPVLLRRLSCASASAAILVGAGLLASGPADASIASKPGSASEATAPGSSMPATVRIAHLSPDMPGVDITITSFSGVSSTYLTNAKYGAVGKYKQVPAGSYTFSIRRHGSLPTSPALQTWSVDAKPGYAYTAAEVGSGSSHRGVVFDDNLTPPKKGYGNVRLIQAASRAGAAQVTVAGGPLVARDAAFGTSTAYAAVKAGTWQLRASGGGLATRRAVSIRPGSVTSVILLDTPAHGLRVVDSVDAAAAPMAPTGSVDAGGGGLARHAAPRASIDTTDDLLVCFAGVLAAALAGLAVRRRVGSRPS